MISHRRLDIPAFARHLAQFLEPERGSILHREGEPRHYFYRFADPLLEQYVVLNGLANGLVKDFEVKALLNAPPISLEPEPTESPTLF